MVQLRLVIPLGDSNGLILCSLSNHFLADLWKIGFRSAKTSNRMPKLIGWAVTAPGRAATTMSTDVQKNSSSGDIPLNALMWEAAHYS